MPKTLFKNEFAEVAEDGSRLVVKFPYSPSVSAKLKTRCSAQWNPGERAWIVDKKFKDWVVNLIRDYFDGEQKLVLAYTDGDSPAVNGAPVVSYSRDSERIKKPFTGAILMRHSHGSRRYPVFGGVTIFRALIASKTEISASEYAVFPDKPELMDLAESIARDTEVELSADGSKELFDKIKSELERVESRTATKAVIVEGFLVASRLLSPAVLQLRFAEIFRGTPLGKKIIDAVTGYFKNKMKRLSAKFYTQILSEHAVKIADGMYLVPTSRAPEFLREVEKLREEYRVYEEKLRAFFYRREVPEGLRKTAKIEPEYLDVLEEYLQGRGMSLSDIEIPAIEKRVSVSLIPLRLAPELFENYVEERARRLRDEKLREVADEVREVREQMVAKIEEEVERKIAELTEKLKEAAKAKVTKKRLRKLKENLKSIEQLASELGMAEIHSPKLRAAEGMIEALMQGKTEDIEKLAEPTSGRVKALLEVAL